MSLTLPALLKRLQMNLPHASEGIDLVLVCCGCRSVKADSRYKSPDTRWNLCKPNRGKN